MSYVTALTSGFMFAAAGGSGYLQSCGVEAIIYLQQKCRQDHQTNHAKGDQQTWYHVTPVCRCEPISSGIPADESRVSKKMTNNWQFSRKTDSALSQVIQNRLLKKTHQPGDTGVRQDSKFKRNKVAAVARFLGSIQAFLKAFLFQSWSDRQPVTLQIVVNSESRTWNFCHQNFQKCQGLKWCTVNVYWLFIYLCVYLVAN